ncbi:MAG: hypothetical protein Ct9H300mP11_15350 [Chloroflexota bacterium]|nr:MAG: hypothetical protein Ct9H300mP11_15350 [Chloroflexota bacterium]
MPETKRIGALVPATNPVVEPDFYRVLPPENHSPLRAYVQRRLGVSAQIL